MKFATFQVSSSKTVAAVVLGDFYYVLAQAFFRTFKRPFVFRDLREFLESDGPSRLSEIDFSALKSDRTVAAPLRSGLLRAPILRPPKIVCVGLNYRAHAAEQKLEPPAQPLLFCKASNAVIGPEESIELPPDHPDCVDAEAEIAVVVGRPGFRIPKEDAWEYVFGFTLINDVTARDVQKSDRQFFRGKSYRTFAPLGPWVVPREEIDSSNLTVRLMVNGEERQRGTTSDLIFDIPTLIEFASACFPLEAGDIFATGTPAGVGVHRNPPLFLKAGDRLELTVDGIGTLANSVQS